jgi:hypothetical protein
MSDPNQRIARLECCCDASQEIVCAMHEEANDKIHALLGGDKFVGLQKQGMWFRPNACGYTFEESAAGRFTLEEAKKREYLHGDFSEHVVIKPFSRPNYFSPHLPIGERLKMVARLSYTQKRDLVAAHLNVSPHEKLIGLSDCVTILELDQPTFASTFLRVVEGKG